MTPYEIKDRVYFCALPFCSKGTVVKLQPLNHGEIDESRFCNAAVLEEDAMKWLMMKPGTP